MVKRNEAFEFGVAEEILRGEFLVKCWKLIRCEKKCLDKKLWKAGSLGWEQEFGRDWDRCERWKDVDITEECDKGRVQKEFDEQGLRRVFKRVHEEQRGSSIQFQYFVAEKNKSALRK